MKRQTKFNSEEDELEWIVKHKPSSKKVRFFFEKHIDNLNEEQNENKPFLGSFSRKEQKNPALNNIASGGFNASKKRGPQVGL
jgi:hypothetical protein